MGESGEAKRDLITVAIEEREELAATAADLYVSIVGESFFTGSAALKKTREVNDLVTALGAAGVAERDVQLQSVRATTATGILRKSSSARYHLRVHCPNLELVGEAVGVITAQKNTDLSPIVWEYADAADVRARLLDRATTRAHETARRIAANLGTRLAGVHRFDERYHDPEDRHGDLNAETDAMFRRKSRRNAIDFEEVPEALGMNVSHRKLVRLRVEVDYHVSGYAGPVSPAQ